MTTMMVSSRPARAMAVAVAASVAVTVLWPQPVAAGSAGRPAAVEQVGGLELSSRHRRGYRNHAAGMAMFGMMVGTIGAIAAAERHRQWRERRYYYGGYPPHAYYYGPRLYAPGFYAPRYHHYGPYGYRGYP